MNRDRWNSGVAAQWAGQIEWAVTEGMGDPVPHPFGVSPFRFYALNMYAPISDATYEQVVADQSRLVAHAILSALMSQRYRAHLENEVRDSADPNWVPASLTNIEVEVDYAGFDTGSDDSLTFEVELDLHLFLSRNKRKPVPFPLR